MWWRASFFFGKKSFALHHSQSTAAPFMVRCTQRANTAIGAAPSDLLTMLFDSPCTFFSARIRTTFFLFIPHAPLAVSYHQSPFRVPSLSPAAFWAGGERQGRASDFGNVSCCTQYVLVTSTILNMVAEHKFSFLLCCVQCFHNQSRSTVSLCERRFHAWHRRSLVWSARGILFFFCGSLSPSPSESLFFSTAARRERESKSNFLGRVGFPQISSVPLRRSARQCGVHGVSSGYGGISE